MSVQNAKGLLTIANISLNHGFPWQRQIELVTDEKKAERYQLLPPQPRSFRLVDGSPPSYKIRTVALS